MTIGNFVASGVRLRGVGSSARRACRRQRRHAAGACAAQLCRRCQRRPRAARLGQRQRAGHDQGARGRLREGQSERALQGDQPDACRAMPRGAIRAALQSGEKADLFINTWPAFRKELADAGMLARPRAAVGQRQARRQSVATRGRPSARPTASSTASPTRSVTAARCSTRPTP